MDFYKHFHIMKMILVLLLSFLILSIKTDASRASEIDSSQNMLLDINPECNIPCKTKRRKKFCGINGKTYNTECEEKRAKCLDPMLTTLPGKCRGAVCFKEREYVMRKMEVDPNHQVPIPTCTEDGKYAARQCSDIFHACWCVSPDGKLQDGVIGSTSEPSCTGYVRRSTACGTGKRTQFLGNLRNKIMSDYSKTATHTEEPSATSEMLRDALEWKFSTLDLNKDEEVTSHELREFLELLQPPECVAAISTFCNSDNDLGLSSAEWMRCLYIPLSAPTSNERFDTTTTAEIDIFSVHQKTTSKILDERCPITQRIQLIRKMRSWLIADHSRKSTSRSSTQPSNRDDAETTAILRRFSAFDLDGNGRLSSKELKPFRRKFRRDNFKDCFFEYCDGNNDGKLTEVEFSNCFSATRQPNCASERREALQSQRAQEAVYVPDCEDEDSQYFSRIQCHSVTGYCWCANRDTGRPDPGTSIKNEKPDCGRLILNNAASANIPGCKKPQAFIDSFQAAIMTKMFQHQQNGEEETISDEDANSSYTDEAARWFFQQLDVSGDHQLNKREAKVVRKTFRRLVSPRKCLRKFMQYCDQNSNKKITFEEFSSCTEATV